MSFIKAKVGPALIGHPAVEFTVHYYDEEGNLTIRSKGSRAWRCHNPGNLIRSRYSMSKNRRAIGFAGDTKNEYAVYPDYNTGHEALIVMLKGGVYSPLSLREASKRYVSSDKEHIHKIMKITNLDPNKTIQSLTDKEFELYWKAIEHIEGWSVGDEDFIEKWYITGVHKKRGTIFEYLINKSGKNRWVAKPEAVKLATEERLHATIIHRKNSFFLRPEYGSKPFKLTEG